MDARASKLETVEEQALLDCVRSGNAAEHEAACQRIFVALREPVFAICLRLTGDAVDAEDALQDTFMAAFRALRSFRGESRLSTWIYRIAVREAIRQRARGRSANETMELDLAAPPVPDPALQREQMEHLQRGLDRLSAEHRTVLIMFAVHGVSHEEIASTLMIPKGTVWSRLHLARKKLAAEMHKVEGDPPLRPTAAESVPRPRNAEASPHSAGSTLLRQLVASIMRTSSWMHAGLAR